MKRGFSPPEQASRTGFALVIVLGFLVLLTVLVIAFYTSVSTDYASSKVYSNGAATKQLADSVVQIVTGQIKTATLGIDPSTKATVTWASQPGMIRSYDTTGSPVTNYKLYSSDAMTTSGTLTLGKVSDFDKQWYSKPSLWTDLNAPVSDATNTANYPIIDGSHLITINGALTYDANADGAPDVQGFSVQGAPVAAQAGSNPIPMPVKWFYQLSDGTLITPDPASTTTATFAGAATQPSASNPIVGRIAFWTDDETSKININTAGEGTYWDTPRFQTASPAVSTIVPGGIVNQSLALMYPDYSYACFPPAQFEFQRYPGHPAQVALSTVFPGLTTLGAIGVTPRIAAGGSQGGTVNAGQNGSVNPASAPRKALYASVDELMFSGPATAFPPSTSDRPQSAIPTTLTKAQLEQAKFFITANSRAPEVNLFGQPRIACWPVDASLPASLANHTTNTRTSAYDRLIAYCSTLRHDQGINAYQYQFQRSNSQSPTYDYDQIPRNQILYKYLQYLTGTGNPVPGFGGNFQAKYPSDRDQILTEIFDYIRCTNLDDPSLGGYPIIPSAMGGAVWPTTTNQFAVAKRTPYDNTLATLPSTSLLGLGQVMPIRIGSTMGFGRFACVKEVGFVFVCTGDGDVSSSNDPLTNPTLGGAALPAGYIRVQMMVLYRLHCPSAGLINYHPDLIVEMANLGSVTVTNATSVGGGGALFSPPPGESGWLEKVSNLANRPYNVPLSFDSLVQPNWRSPVNNTSNFQSYPYYPFVSQPFTVKKTDGILFGGANLTVKIFQGKNAYDDRNNLLGANYKELGAPKLTDVTSDLTNNLYQTATLQFPTGTFPPPTYSTAPPANPPAAPNAVTTTSRIEDRLYYGGANTNGAGLVLNNDTIRTMYFNGDARLAALMSTIPAGKFTTYANYSTSPTAPAVAQHQLLPNVTGFTGNPIGGAGSSTYTSSYAPPGATATTGDYDLISRVDLGALINKPDEGDSSNLANGGGNPPYYFFDQRTDYANLYTPNRIMPSPGMFGSLPTGAQAGANWQTLLFRPQVGHPGANSPPDHLIMDLFWMPVVEPYAISEPFSTAGKVNMNYQIAPFTYIDRATGMLSAMKIEMTGAVPSATGAAFPADPNNGQNSWRRTLNLSETNGSLRQFQEKFNAGDLFRSASQICEVYLVPTGQSFTSNTAADQFWSNNKNTPENVREKSYTNLYAHLTTKSNSYTVHFRVQSLQKSSGTDATQWVEGRDTITGEYRGSSLIERYVDPDDTSLKDFATEDVNNPSPSTANPNPTLDSFYKFRVVSTKKFAP